jgi:hypothetical protein
MSETKLPYVVVRTYSAGVHVGELVSREGKEVTLANARRIWSWTGANTLHEIAKHGVGDMSKVSETLGTVLVTEAIEVLYAEPEGEANLRAAKWAP